MYVVAGGDGVRILNQQGPAAHRALLLRPASAQASCPGAFRINCPEFYVSKNLQSPTEVEAEGHRIGARVLCYSRIVIVLLVVLDGVDEA
jgi:hypothetical protein